VSKRRIRHYSVKRNGRGFWEPTPKMKALGFGSVPCGPDGPGAWALAEEWNRRWDATRTGRAPSPAMVSAQNLTLEQGEEFTVYPPRSLGEAFGRYRRTAEWSRKATRTREDWWRGWKRIKPVFGDCDPQTVQLDDVSAWRQVIEDTVSLREAHRALKIWRRCGRYPPRSATASAMRILRSGSATRQQRADRRHGGRGRPRGLRSARGGSATLV
jgi:hypothetical protein